MNRKFTLRGLRSTRWKKVSTLVVGLFLALSAFSQDASGWSGIGLRIDGGNVAYGVYAYYQLSTYNGSDVVLMKFVNSNSYPVIVEWYPEVFTNEHKWLRKDDAA